MRFTLEENEESMCKILNYINVCAVLHNFLLMENESGEMFYEDEGYTSDLDADNELNHPVGDQESHTKRRSQLTVHFAESGFLICRYPVDRMRLRLRQCKRTRHTT